ncbi:hypothetical protein QAD02_021437 [Eretmocerus hayati]|uniref:Uncharacterized protein n=1 Tax=Eretmocerus hayati TaxID=131215 RepID=A0ACC2PPX1_9HYME|nr:hypothetical protein QAD02_021437 [Eretmocerus hayati]
MAGSSTSKKQNASVEDDRSSSMGATCLDCPRYLKSLSRSDKIILTESSAQKLSELMSKDLNAGEIICRKCCYSFFKNMNKRPKLDVPVSKQEDQNQGSSQQSLSSNSSELVQVSSQQSSGELYEVPEKPEIGYVKVPFSRTIISCGYCFICNAKTDLVVVPEEARLQTFSVKQIYIQKKNRCCAQHMIHECLLYKDELDKVTAYANESSIPSSEFTTFMSRLSSKVSDGLFEHIGEWTISDARLKVFTGHTSQELKDLVSTMKSLRESENRNAVQAVVTCLFKLRTGSSDELIASILDLRRPRLVSQFCASVLKSFEVDILPRRFGPSACTRDYLIKKSHFPCCRQAIQYRK